MDYIYKLFKRISVKDIAVNLIGLLVAMSIIWGVSYLILVTFSIQESSVIYPIETVPQLKVATSTSKIKTSVATSTHATTTSSSTKSKK